jgi:hypothetical protein
LPDLGIPEKCLLPIIPCMSSPALKGKRSGWW